MSFVEIKLNKRSIAMVHYISICALQLILWNGIQTHAYSLRSSFNGRLVQHMESQTAPHTKITMRKQKASDRRTRRMQKNSAVDSALETLPLRPGSSPLTPLSSGAWTHKTVVKNQFVSSAKEGGRGRSRKRSIVYSNLASYHNHFLELLTKEFLAEVSHDIRSIAMFFYKLKPIRVTCRSESSQFLIGASQKNIFYS